MKRITFFIIALAISLSVNAQDYQSLWKEYEENIENLLPESAEKTLNKIENLAFKDKNDIQLLKTAVKRCDIFSMTAEKVYDTIVGFCNHFMPMLSDASQVVLKVGMARYTGNYNDIKEYRDNDFIKTVSMENYAEIFQNDNEKTIYDIELEPTLYDYVMHCLIRNYKHYDIEKELYEKLLAFDLEKNYIKAYYNNRIKQLGYIDEKNFGDFSKLASECTDNEFVAKIKIIQIEYLVYRSEYVEAKKLCDEIMASLDNKHPLYLQSVEFINSLSQKTIDIKLNSVCVPNQAIAAGLSYRNTNNPSYKIYKVSTSEYLKLSKLEKEDFYIEIFSKKPIVEKTLEIPAETDYKEHSTLIAIQPLRCGVYFIVFSNNNSFKNHNDLINIPFQVSNLAFFKLETDDDFNMYVVNRETGQPMGNVTAHFTEQHYSYKTKSWEKQEIGNVISDMNGFLVAPKSQKNTYFIDLYHNGDTLLSTQYFSFYIHKNVENLKIKSEFFTDRKIYRPGQTVQFSCLVYRGDSKHKEVVADYETLIEFHDTNNQLIDTLRLTTNEFGAVSGSFTIPTDRLNGNYNIRDKNGSTIISVEEYKRPTFEVTFEAPTSEYKIGDSITVCGKVAALSGFGLDGVKYTYQVVRKTLFPYRYWGWNPYHVSDETVASGKSTTFNDGGFKIDFKLSPSDEVEVFNIPKYTYEITVEATSKQGETQKGEYQVSATYNKYDIRLERDGKEFYEIECVEAKDLNSYNIMVSNMLGKTASTKVECKIFKFNDLSKYEQDLGSFDRQILSDQQLDDYFPRFDFYAKEKTRKDVVYQRVVDVNGEAKLLPENQKLKPGKYLIELKSVDDTLSVFYNECVVIDVKSKAMPYKTLYWTYIDKESAQPGETINYFVGSSEKNSSALIIVKSGKKIVKSQRIPLNNNICKFSYKVREEDRGRLDFQVAIVKYNNEMRRVDYVNVPYNNMDLDITLHTERDKMLPGAEETLSVTIKDYKGKPVEVPLIASMYDAALDNFQRHYWYLNTKPSIIAGTIITTDKSFQTQTRSQDFRLFRYRQEENDMFSDVYLVRNRYGLKRYSNKLVGDVYYHMNTEVVEEAAVFRKADFDDEITDNEEVKNFKSKENKPIKTRKDFNETAFFYPDLRTDKDGNCTFTFTMPDALTRWNLMLLAYSKDLKVGRCESSFVTQQPLMIMADMPRFAYDEDTLWFAANVINMGDKDVKPIAKLEISDESGKPVDLIISDQTIDMGTIPAGQSRVVKWLVAMQKDLNILKFRFSAITDGFSDAEQHEMPVLSTDIFLTQTYALTVTANSTKEYEYHFNNEIERNHDIKLDVKENPVFYAVQSLPYIAEDDEKYATTAFNRYFTNKMASEIIKNNPKIVEMLKEHADDTISELQKNEELKAVLLKETPWVLEAKSEAQQRANVAKLFDNEAIVKNIASALDILANKQTVNGGWPWIEGMPESEYITQYILCGLGRLDTRNTMSEKAFHFIENQVVEQYNKLDTQKKKKSAICDYTTMKELLGMSYFNYKTSEKFDEAKTFFIKKLHNDWKRYSQQEQAHIALILNRNGYSDKARLIIKSLRERAVKNQFEMYWRGCGVEDAARILEAFNEIEPNIEETDAMRFWILSQKRTNMWESDRATVEAIFAIMERGTDWTSENTQSSMLADNGDVKVVIENASNHMVWGGLYRQYFVPIDKVQKHNDEMKITREIIAPENATVGDKVTVKITFENSQDMEFVYLKDLRGACFEPTEQLSQYHFSDGMWYYQSTTDVSMEYFIENLPKGKHTVSHTMYITKEGSFSAGYSLIQCQYAPEFGAYSNGSRISVNP